MKRKGGLIDLTASENEDEDDVPRQRRPPPSLGIRPAAPKLSLYRPPPALQVPLDPAATKPWSNQTEMRVWMDGRDRRGIEVVGGFDVGVATPSVAHLKLRWSEAGALEEVRLDYAFSLDMRRGWKKEGPNGGHDALAKRQIEEHPRPYRRPHLLASEYQARINLSNVMVEKAVQQELRDKCVVLSAKLAKEAYPDIFIMGGHTANKNDAIDLVARIVTEAESDVIDAALEPRRQAAAMRRLERGAVRKHNEKVEAHNRAVEKAEKAWRKDKSKPKPGKKMRAKTMLPEIDVNRSHISDAVILAFMAASMLAGRDLIRERLAVRAARLGIHKRR